MTITHLAHRRLLCLAGDGPIALLQDILTADIASLAVGEMRQSCLLSPQGRILIEMTIIITRKIAGDEQLYIACDHSQVDELAAKLKLYRLRRKITITSCPDLALIASDTPIKHQALICAKDERAPNRGSIAIIEKEALTSFTPAASDSYLYARLADGIPEGPEELTPNRALILEAGLDIFEAVDFKKGCYIGQEVTARTRYRGLVKRRLIPVKATHMAKGSQIMQDGKEVGTVLSTARDETGAIGLASVRLHAIHAAQEGQMLHCGDEMLQLAIPAHFPPLPQPDEKAKKA